MASAAAHAAIRGRSASRMQVKPVGIPKRAFMARMASIKALALAASVSPDSPTSSARRDSRRCAAVP